MDCGAQILRDAQCRQRALDMTCTQQTSNSLILPEHLVLIDGQSIHPSIFLVPPYLQARGRGVPLRASAISPGIVETEFFTVSFTAVFFMHAHISIPDNRPSIPELGYPSDLNLTQQSMLSFVLRVHAPQLSFIRSALSVTQRPPGRLPLSSSAWSPRTLRGP